MLAFEISLNGERLCIAGAGEHGVVSAIVHWVRRKPLADGNETPPGWESEELELDVGGVDSSTNEYLKWLKQDLEVGSEISVRVIEVDQVDSPKHRLPVNTPPVSAK